MGNIQIFKNEEFGQVRVAIDKNNEPLFCLSDICKVLEIKNVSDCKSRLDRKGIALTDTPTNGGIQSLVYVNEKNLYKVIMRSDKPQAEPFQDWVCGEVLPSIRKHGAYMTNKTLEKALTSPDFLIQLATQLKEEQQKRIEAEQKNTELLEDNDYKNSVIEGLVTEIPLADMRQRISQIMRKGGVSGIKEAYRLLYSEFDKKYHINISTRINNILYKGTKMDYIEKELNMLPELYELTCKLFESSYESLMKEWGKNVKRAQGKRNA